MSYSWWKFVHLAGVVGFMAAHGTSMAAAAHPQNPRSPAQAVINGPTTKPLPPVEVTKTL